MYLTDSDIFLDNDLLLSIEVCEYENVTNRPLVLNFMISKNYMI